MEGIVHLMISKKIYSACIFFLGGGSGRSGPPVTPFSRFFVILML